MNSLNEIIAEFNAGHLSMDRFKGQLESWAGNRFWEQCAIAAAASYDALHDGSDVAVWAFDLADAMLAERNRRLKEMGK